MRTFIFQLWEGLLIALRAIRVNKLRSVLTTLGIVIGIVTVTAMFTTINGIERGFDKSMEMIGSNVLYVQKWPWFGDNEWWKYINRPNITADLAEVIDERARYVTAVAPIAQTARPIYYRDRSVAGGFIQGSTADFTRVENPELTAGRFYNEFDVRTGRNVVVVGAEIAEQLFPAENPLGKVVRMGGHRFQVIGVLERQGKFLGLFSFDTQVQIPITAFKKAFGMNNRSLTIEVRVPSADLLDEAEDELTGVVRAARQLDAREEDDFAINRQEAFRAQFDAMKVVIYGVGLFLTALSLLVGGIGVMNIMFVSVTERTREIGIRKAVGARTSTIMTQFLIEAVMICSFGGLIGIALSFGVTALINSFFTAQMSGATVALAFSICVGIGIIFGFIPARKAAKSNPIEALRYE